MQPEDLPHVVRILKREIQRWPVPAIAHYADKPFTVLMSCLLSLRTQDKTTVAASDRLFAIATDPKTTLATPVKTIEKAIYPVSFFRTKAKTIHAICEMLFERFAGKVPSDMESLLSLPGVGRKTANIVITLAFRKPGIAVDIHVHRISNRLGYVRSRMPDETEMKLRKKLPRRYWIIWNDLLVAYGQNHCKPISPFCSSCRIAEYCKRVGVKSSR
jgi:endonuclease-3